MASASASGEKPPSAPHMILVPLLSPGHIIPMTDLGRLLAQRGARVSLVTTPHNAARLQPSVDRSRASGLLFDLVSLPLPSADPDLPDGRCYESIDAIPTSSFMEMCGKLTVSMAQRFAEPLRRFMASAGATCLISDFCMPCTREVALEFGVPRYVFYSICCFTIYCHRVMPVYFETHKVEGEDSNSKAVVVPGLPHRVEMTKEQSRGICYGAPEWLLAGLAEAEATADGLVVNTFSALEQDYIEIYGKEIGKKVYSVGPVSLCNSDAGDRANRAGGPDLQPSKAIDEYPHCKITEWLDSKAPRSVVYICLGSLVREHPLQLKEIGAGLQAAGSPFLWVVRVGENVEEVEACLREVEQRCGDACMIVRGWVPQLTILSHPSVGGYVSHCGWNSLAEAIAAGVPVATWACFADQLANAKFAVEVAGVGVPVVGCERPLESWWGGDEVGRRMVIREEVEEAARRLMDGGEEAEATRRRVLDLADKGRRALEVGGTSDANLTALIEESVQLAKERHASPLSCSGDVRPEICHDLDHINTL